MYKHIILLTTLVINIYGFNGATSDKERCAYLKKLPAISNAFYEKFHDADATKSLIKDDLFYFLRRDAVSCLDKEAFNALLNKYASLLVLTDDIRTLERLIELEPKKIFLIKSLGDLYKHRYTSNDRRYMRDKAQNRVLALEHYKSYIEKGGKPTKEIESFIKSGGLLKAENKWSDKLPINNSVSKNRFKAIYFNRKEPEKIIKSEYVKYPAVNYESDKFPGYKLPSNNFCAFWVQDYVAKEDQDMILNFRVSWAEYRLIIDGYEVSKSINTNQKVPYHFTKGIHRIEIEYTNNYGATDFMMTMQDKKSFKEIETKEIKEHLKGDYVLLYMGLYESNNFDNSLTIEIEKNYKKPVVLLLSSSGNISWNIKPNENQLNTVFVTSQTQGSIVAINDVPMTQNLFHLKDFRGENHLGYQCKCSNFHTYCSGAKISTFDTKISAIFGKSLDGFTTIAPKDRTKNKLIKLPKITLNNGSKEKVLREEAEALNIKNRCEQEKNLGIDDIF